MKNSIYVTVFLLLFITATIFPDNIRLAADMWMPYNGDGKTETGYMLDLAKTVFEGEGHQVAYEVVPWSRAVTQTREGTYDGIIGAYKTDAPDFIYPENEQGLAGQVFYVKKETNWRYGGINSLNDIRLAVILDYSYYPELDGYIKANKANESRIKISFGTQPLESNMNNLITGHVDAVVDNSYVLEYTINKLKIKDKLVSGGIGSKQEKMYIAFSPKNTKSATYAKMLSDGIDKLRKSGKLQNILDRYGLKDWK